jgi:hypothetical protein
VFCDTDEESNHIRGEGQVHLLIWYKHIEMTSGKEIKETYKLGLCFRCSALILIFRWMSCMDSNVCIISVSNVKVCVIIDTFLRVLRMVYDNQACWVFGLCPWSGILKNTTFQKLDMSPSSGEGVDWGFLLLMDATEHMFPTPSPEDGKRSSFWNFVFFRISDDGWSLKTR